MASQGKQVAGNRLFEEQPILFNCAPSLVFQNEGPRSVQLLTDSRHGPYTLLPGDSVVLELSGAEGPCQICFYEGGVQVTGGATRQDRIAASARR